MDVLNELGQPHVYWIVKFYLSIFIDSEQCILNDIIIITKVYNHPIEASMEFRYSTSFMCYPLVWRNLPLSIWNAFCASTKFMWVHWLGSIDQQWDIHVIIQYMEYSLLRFILYVYFYLYLCVGIGWEAETRQVCFLWTGLWTHTNSRSRLYVCMYVKCWSDARCMYMCCVYTYVLVTTRLQWRTAFTARGPRARSALGLMQ